MEAKDLRVGNLLFDAFNNRIGEVLRLNAGGMYPITYAYNKSYEFSPPYGNDLQGIPLTPDWLQRMGFERHNGNENDWRKGLPNGDGVDLSIELIDKEACLVRKHVCDGVFNGGLDYCYISPIEYVHTLQNGWHFLTGEELTINQ